jgi:hypothetical protein
MRDKQYKQSHYIQFIFGLKIVSSCDESLFKGQIPGTQTEGI